MSHAILPPSSAHRWLRCARYCKARLDGRIQPQPTSAAALRGTILHAYMEVAVRHALRSAEQFPPPVHLPPKEMAALDSALSTVWQILDTVDGCPQLEQRVEVLMPWVWGTADVVVLHEDVLCVIDYKFGRLPVSALDNLQLQMYALGAMRDTPPSIKYAQLHIIQPAEETRQHKTAQVSRESLVLLSDKIETWIEEVEVAPAARCQAVSGTWCQWCELAAQHQCEEGLTLGSRMGFAIAKPEDFEALEDE